VNLCAAAILGLVAAGLVVVVRRGSIDRGPLRALISIAALLAMIMALALIVSPYAE
jgi:hypothetical protein